MIAQLLYRQYALEKSVHEAIEFPIFETHDTFCNFFMIEDDVLLSQPLAREKELDRLLQLLRFGSEEIKMSERFRALE